MMRADAWDMMVRSAQDQELGLPRSGHAAGIRRSAPTAEGLPPSLLQSRTENELLALLVQTQAAERHLSQCVRQIQHELAAR